MKLILVGSRTFTDYQLPCHTLAPERPRITEVLHGGARDADQLGCMQQLGKPVVVIRVEATA